MGAHSTESTLRDGCMALDGTLDRCHGLRSPLDGWVKVDWERGPPAPLV